MATKYVLGEGAARKLKAMFRDGKPIVPGGGAEVVGVHERSFYPPFTCLYSATYGGWVIYLPRGAWSGVEGRTSLTVATTFDAGGEWFALPTNCCPYYDQMSLTDVAVTVHVGAKNGEMHLSPGAGPRAVAVLSADSYALVKDARQICAAAITERPKPFEVYASTTDSSTGVVTWQIAGGYFRAGNVVYSAADATLTLSSSDGDNDGVVVCLKVPATTSGITTATIEKIAPGQIATRTRDLDYSYLPLYLAGNGMWDTGEIKVDLRGAPTSVQFEV